ncbi:DUF4184 family protein [Cellulomonas endometrii]|uniref:DUF4184 family protein n=1 Tax=Cellulomonas endometrii TaxID=3036301 RepID=UPI0024AE1740|nr:DUF4184 family protein [Cellulomonas endometrii]
MPFTLAHPAAVLPLARGPLVPSALVAGSLSPDVPYFLPVPRSAGSWYEPFVNATATHSWPGAVTAAVPLAAALLGLWWVVRAPLRSLVATGQDQRRVPRSRQPARAIPWVLVSLTLGVLTHVAWDAFTHGDGAVVQKMAWLREPLVGDVTAARVLQHVSTAVGLLALAVWGARRVGAWHAGGGRLVLDRARLLTVLVLGGAGVAGAVVGAAGSAGAGLEVALSSAAKDGGTACAVVALAGAGVWWLRRLSRPLGARVAITGDDDGPGAARG